MRAKVTYTAYHRRGSVPETDFVDFDESKSLREMFKEPRESVLALFKEQGWTLTSERYTVSVTVPTGLSKDSRKGDRENV